MWAKEYGWTPRQCFEEVTVAQLTGIFGQANAGQRVISREEAYERDNRKRILKGLAPLPVPKLKPPGPHKKGVKRG